MSSGPSWTTALATLGAIVVVSRVVKVLQGLKAVGSLPGLRIPFEPLSLFAIILPETWWNPSLLFTWTWRKNRNIYRRYGCDTVSIVPFIGGSPMIYTRSMEVGRQIIVAGHRSGAFGKTDEMGGSLLFWGPNIISSEGELWRKHRRISSPAFNNDTYAFVWDASRKLYAEMVSAEGWASKDIVDVPSVHELTSKLTLIVFVSVGFGFPFTWSDPPTHQSEMSVQECLKIVTKTNIFAVGAPAWSWKLPFEWMIRTRRAYDTMRAFVRSQITTIRENIQSEVAHGATKPARDLFSLLVRASDDAGGNMALDDDELIGNVFSFLLAGHETTAHSLAATLAFLALDSDLQDELVAQVQEVTRGRDDDAVLLEDYGKLDKVLAAFYEGIRMFRRWQSYVHGLPLHVVGIVASGVFLIRAAKQDTVIDISDGDDPRMLSVKKGTYIVLDMVGVQYNPRYFSEPDEFWPSRWYRKQRDSDEKDVSEEFTAFGIGPRACLGRKFGSTEAVCFLALLLRDWRVEPLLAMQPNGQTETVDEWRGRVFQARINLTLGIHDVPLRFVRRQWDAAL